jgi:hypothetical protein
MDINHVKAEGPTSPTEDSLIRTVNVLVDVITVLVNHHPKLAEEIESHEIHPFDPVHRRLRSKSD